MKNNDLITFMIICQIVNLYIMFFHKDKNLFLEKKSGKFFLFLPFFVIASLYWRPL